MCPRGPNDLASDSLLKAYSLGRLKLNSSKFDKESEIDDDDDEDTEER